MIFYLLAVIIMSGLFGCGYRIGQLKERQRNLPKRAAAIGFQLRPEDEWDYVPSEKRTR